MAADSTSNQITLREYLEQRIDGIENKLDLKLDAIDQRFEARDGALVLQADANAAHFDALNHEAARILKAAEITVSRDTWDEFQKGYAEWKSSVDRIIERRTGQGQAALLSWQTFLAIFGAVALAITAWAAIGKSSGQPIVYAQPIAAAPAPH